MTDERRKKSAVEKYSWIVFKLKSSEHPDKIGTADRQYISEQILSVLRNDDVVYETEEQFTVTLHNCDDECTEMLFNKILEVVNRDGYQLTKIQEMKIVKVD